MRILAFLIVIVAAPASAQSAEEALRKVDSAYTPPLTRKADNSAGAWLHSISARRLRNKRLAVRIHGWTSGNRASAERSARDSPVFVF